MVYLALLRGINVGGNNKVDMKQLKVAFEEAGMTNVRTYINSGNIIFETKTTALPSLTSKLESVIESNFGFHVKVLLITFGTIETVVKALPDTWLNDSTMKCDIMFLWEHVNKPAVLDELRIKPEIEDVQYVAGAIIWRVDRKNVTKSGIARLVGTDLYKHMTIRNCNTVRKLYALMQT